MSSTATVHQLNPAAGAARDPRSADPEFVRRPAPTPGAAPLVELTTTRPAAMAWAAIVLGAIAAAALSGELLGEPVLQQWLPTSYPLTWGPALALLLLAGCLTLLDRARWTTAVVGGGALLVGAGAWLLSQGIAIADRPVAGVHAPILTGVAGVAFGALVLLARHGTSRWRIPALIVACAAAALTAACYASYALPVGERALTAGLKPISAPAATAGLVASAMAVAHLLARIRLERGRPALRLYAHSLVVGWVILLTLMTVVCLWIIGGVDRARIADALVLQREHAHRIDDWMIWQQERIVEDLEDLARAPGHRSLVDRLLAGEAGAAAALAAEYGPTYRSGWVRTAGGPGGWVPLWADLPTTDRSYLAGLEPAGSERAIIIADERLLLAAVRSSRAEGEGSAVELGLIKNIGINLDPTDHPTEIPSALWVSAPGNQGWYPGPPPGLATDQAPDPTAGGGSRKARQFVAGQARDAQLVTVLPLHGGASTPPIQLALTRPQAEVVSIEHGRDLGLVIGIWLAAAVVGSLCSYLVRAWTRPIQNSAELLGRLGHPDVDPENGGLPVDLSRLARSAGRVQQLLEQRTEELMEARDRLAAEHANLERSNEDLRQFAYVASHDLQEPLRQIEMLIDILEREQSDGLGAEARAFMARMSEASRRMRRMIQSLLAYSRASTRDLELEAVDLNETLLLARNDLAVAIAESGAEIEVGALPVVEGDPAQLEACFVNLLSNAIKFCDDRPRIRVAAVSGEPRTVEVRDQGIGFDQAYAAQALQPFKRLHPRDRYPGSGIGLATCQRICERIGAELSIESAVGAGTTVRIRFPEREAAATDRDDRIPA